MSVGVAVVDGATRIEWTDFEGRDCSFEVQPDGRAYLHKYDPQTGADSEAWL